MNLPAAPQGLQRAALAVGVLAALVGLVVRVAWHFEWQAVLTAGQGVVMAPTTALALTLSGGALALLALQDGGRRRRWAGRALALMVALLAAGLLVEAVGLGPHGPEVQEYLNQLGFDRPEMRRVSFNGAFNLLLLSLAMLTLESRGRLRAADILSLVVLVNSAIAIVSYVLGTSPFYGVPGLIPISGMALHTSIATALLACGVLAARPHTGLMSTITSDLAGGQMVRPLLAVAMAAPLLSAAVVLGERLGLYGRELRAPIAVGLVSFVAIATTLAVARRLNLTDQQRRLAERRALELEQRASAEHRFFAEVGERLADSLDLKATLDAVVRAAVPYLADWAVIDLAGEDGPLRRSAILHSDPARAEVAAALLQMSPVPARMPEGVESAVRSNETLVLRDLDDAWLRANTPPPKAELLKQMGLRSYIIVPLIARGRALGALTFCLSQRNFTEEEIRVAEELGRRAALYADNARLYDEAQRAVRAREEVVAMVSHDLRNPLNAIRLGLQLVARRLPAEVPPGGRDPLGPLADVERASRRALELIEQLLEFSRIDSGTLWLHREEVPAALLVAQVSALMQHIGEERGISLVTSVQPELQACCDVPRIQRVLENLIGNAIKFSPEGSTVRITATSHDGEVLFEVADSGPGIPPQFAEHVFDRYWRSPEGRAGEGAGLGLAISKGIVLAHGGAISVRSEPGCGSTFGFTVPSVCRQAAEAQGPAPIAPH